MARRSEAPGLKYRARKNGPPVPVWVASDEARKAGYPVKSVNLSDLAHDWDLMAARCRRLHHEMQEWLQGGETEWPFDGTFGSLFDFYERHESSPFRAVKPSTRRPYATYLRKLRDTIGERRIDRVTGLDIERWHRVWRAPDEPGGPPKLAAARMALAVIKNALAFGKRAGFKGCAELKSVLTDLDMPGPAPRSSVPTLVDVEAIIAAAHAAGLPSIALTTAFQFDGALRLWDVIGRWLPLSEPDPSAIIARGQKWIGPHWKHIGSDMVLRWTPSKTEDTTGQEVVIDLAVLPLLMAEIDRTPPEARIGPLVVCEMTGLPWVYGVYRAKFRQVADAAGIRRSLWARDMRAGAVTEARQGGAALEDAAKLAGHSDVKTTRRVYDRDVLEASRRVAEARRKVRNKP